MQVAKEMEGPWAAQEGTTVVGLVAHEGVVGWGAGLGQEKMEKVATEVAKVAPGLTGLEVPTVLDLVVVVAVVAEVGVA